MSPLQRLADRTKNAIGSWQILVLETVWERRVKAGDAKDRRLQVVDRAFLDRRDQLSAEPAGAWRLVHNHAAPGFLHARQDGRDVERQQRAEINHLDGNAYVSSLGRGVLGDRNHTTPC